MHLKIIVKYPSQWISLLYYVMFITRDTLGTGSVGVQKNVQSEYNCTVAFPVSFVSALNWYANRNVGVAIPSVVSWLFEVNADFSKSEFHMFCSVFFITSSLRLNLRTNNTICIRDRVNVTGFERGIKLQLTGCTLLFTAEWIGGIGTDYTSGSRICRKIKISLENEINITVVTSQECVQWSD
jgi:hypothetical protein